MTNVGMLAMAMNARGIREKNTDVVQQGCFFQKLFIKVQLGVTVGYPESLIGHLTTMCQQYMLQFVVFGIIFINDS